VLAGERGWRVTRLSQGVLTGWVDMRRSWLDRITGRADVEAVRQELGQLAAQGDLEAVLAAARGALRQLPEDPVVLLWAVRARAQTAARGDAAAASEAVGWLDTLLKAAPRDSEALYWRGVCEQLAGRASAAEEFWRKAWEADPRRLTPALARGIGEALTRIWVGTGQLPEWGVPVVETTLLDNAG
jgi:tetratricopeptide (TPR) repeat protein